MPFYAVTPRVAAFYLYSQAFAVKPADSIFMLLGYSAASIKNYHCSKILCPFTLTDLGQLVGFHSIYN